jgi:hypothetical protein
VPTNYTGFANNNGPTEQDIRALRSILIALRVVLTACYEASIYMPIVSAYEHGISALCELDRSRAIYLRDRYEDEGEEE